MWRDRGYSRKDSEELAVPQYSLYVNTTEELRENTSYRCMESYDCM